MHPESHAPCDRKTKGESLVLHRPKAEKESGPKYTTTQSYHQRKNNHNRATVGRKGLEASVSFPMAIKGVVTAT